MKDKEWLLSFECPLRFIFSHSALKEGWDNPNVFQVCTLIEQKSTFTCRQKVGRGLRLCVDQEGNRIEDRNINILHVMANESFAEFAENLQREIESETGVKFGVLQLSLFSGLTYTETVTEEKTVTPEQAEKIAEYIKSLIAPVVPAQTEKQEEPATKIERKIPAQIAPPADLPVAVVEKVVEAVKLGAPVEEVAAKIAQTTYTETREVEKSVGYDDAAELLTHFEKKGYVTKSGNIKDTMKAALAAGTLDLPAKFEAARERFETVIKKADQKPVVHDAAQEVRVHLKKQVMLSPEFLALWDKIKGRTAYRVSLDENELKNRCVKELQSMERVSRARVVTKTARYNIDHPGVSFTETELRAFDTDGDFHILPDFIRALDDECFLSRATAVDILRQSGRLGDFLNNPQKMTEMFVEAVRHVQDGMEIDGIRYMRLDGEEYYLQEIFGSEELTAYLDKNAVAVENSVYDHVIYDSDTVERPFAIALDGDSDVKMFFKIPAKFQIETPIGTYNPDWAVYVDKDGVERLYFVLETKGTTRLDSLRGEEAQKIICGERHFAALDNGVVFSGKPLKDWHDYKVSI
jgi:type III restriction enzyme